MLDFVENDCFSQMVNEPTRESNIFDLAIASQENLLDNVSFGKHLGSCDHSLVLLDIELKQGLQRI